MNLPNSITVSRIASVPLLIWILSPHFPWTGHGHAGLRGGTLDVTAPLPPHMQHAFDLFGFDVKRYDPIENAPE